MADASYAQIAAILAHKGDILSTFAQWDFRFGSPTLTHLR